MLLPALFALALAGPPPPGLVPAPPPPPGVIRYELAVKGRLKAGASLNVSVTETFVPTSAPSGPTGSTAELAPMTLCYKHGTSRRLCGPSETDVWTVRLEPSRDQFLTLRIGDVTVARLLYRAVRIVGPPARGTAPRDATVKIAPDEPAPLSATGGLSGPKAIRVGSTAYLWWDQGAPSTLCYKHGTSRVSCQRSLLGGFYVTVQPGRDQYFTLRVARKVRSRLVYHHVT